MEEMGFKETVIEKEEEEMALGRIAREFDEWKILSEEKRRNGSVKGCLLPDDDAPIGVCSSSSTLHLCPPLVNILALPIIHSCLFTKIIFQFF